MTRRGLGLLVPFFMSLLVWVLVFVFSGRASISQLGSRSGWEHLVRLVMYLYYYSIIHECTISMTYQKMYHPEWHTRWCGWRWRRRRERRVKLVERWRFLSTSKFPPHLNYMNDPKVDFYSSPETLTLNLTFIIAPEILPYLPRYIVRILPHYRSL